MMQREGFEASHACQIARVSRAGFYRHYEQHEPRQADVALRDLIQKIALENRFYGYRRVTAELQHRGTAVNHKRVLRADNLLVVRKLRFVFTTDSRHDYAVYPNLAPRLNLTGIDQLWVADITYVRLRETFLYLAIVMDAYSRKVVGWELGEDLRAELALGALNRALVDRHIEPGIVHHSDRGVQYCCLAYVAKLQAHGFRISMSRTGNPYDNAKAESFMKTLKAEEVYLQQYRDQEDARTSIQRFIEEVYNRKRLQSGVNPSAETRKLGTGYHSLTIRGQQSAPSPYWRRLVKRRRALLESNPPRNSQPGNSSRTMSRARSSSRRVL